MKDRNLRTIFSTLFSKGKFPPNKFLINPLTDIDYPISEDCYLEAERYIGRLVSIDSDVDKSIKQKIKKEALTPVDDIIKKWFIEMGVSHNAKDIFEEKNSYTKIELALDRVRELTLKYECKPNSDDTKDAYRPFHYRV